jgi:hypothetical protein
MAREGKMTDAEEAEHVARVLPPTDRPGLDRYSIIQWEWGEAEYRFFEIVTGESIDRDEDGPRDPDL